ncbi:MAG: sel1 repeat family protein [Cystobacterineae bacterium]|nr:sel1 repeat family protein [Cystobacterineae bacterium]
MSLQKNEPSAGGHSAEEWDGLLEGEEATYKELIEIAQKAANQGDATAQYFLGAAHYFGKGVAIDLKAAFEWYFKAAAQGLPHAQYNLGVMYASGEACPPNPEKAFLWYEKAAAQGLAKAQHNLAALWEAGLGAPKDVKKAAQCYEAAAQQGDVRAQYRLALLCLKEEEGLQQGLQWLQKALEQNFAPAKYTLGLLLENGVGMPQNTAEARRLYEEAALSALPEAQAALERLK